MVCNWLRKDSLEEEEEEEEEEDESLSVSAFILP